MQNRKEIEIDCGKQISEKAERLWGWASFAGRIRAQRRAELIGNGLPSSKSGVLEIGCGVGTFTCKIGSKRPVIATDISLDLLKKARKNCQGKGFFIVADAENLPFRNGSFQAVYGSSVLHHLDMDSVLAEMKRVLRKEGRIVFAEPNMINPQVFLEMKVNFIKKYFNVLPHEKAFYRWGLKKILGKNGFETLIMRPFDFLHPLTPAFMIRFISKLSIFVEKIPIIKEIAGSLFIVALKR